jgi:hypothetical protein
MVGNVFRSRRSIFRTRSSARDNTHIEALVQQVASALDHAASEVEAQRDGLKARLDAVMTRAVVIGGNDIEDVSTRDHADAALLAASDAEIARAGARLKALEEQLSSFHFLEAALYARFPDLEEERDS